MKHSNFRSTMLFVLLLLGGQMVYGQCDPTDTTAPLDSLNLLIDASCELNAAVGGNPDTHVFSTWTQNVGSAQCFNATSLSVPDASPSAGDFFFADANPSATLTEISQTVDLGQDRSGKDFFYSYDYRMSDMNARPTHTMDIVIEFLDGSNTAIGTLHSNLNFTDSTPNLLYKTESGTATAPAGTQKIKWTARWEDPGVYNEILLDNMILRYDYALNTNNVQCIGGSAFPYLCFSDPLTIDGDVIQMTCAQFFDDAYIESLLNISCNDICDQSGGVKIKRPKSSSNLKGESQEKSGANCLLDLEFIGEFSTNNPCVDTLRLQVDISGSISPTISAPPSISVPCGYDLITDPLNLIGSPTNIFGFLDGYTVSASTNNCGGQVTITWRATDCCDNADATANQIINIEAAVANDLCENAIPIQCGDFILGDNMSATTTNNTAATGVFATAACPTPNFSVFYSFQGTGRMMKISTDYPATNFDTRISVYTGTCAAPVCVAHGDDIALVNTTPPCTGSNLRSEVSFSTVVGQTYYLMLDGTTGCIADRGFFGFSLECLFDDTIACGEIKSGDTAGQGNDFELSDYGTCASGLNFNGNEVAYLVTVNQQEFYDFSLTPYDGDLDLILLELDSQGNITNCIDASTEGGTNQELISVELYPGQYLVVVDAYTNSVESTYDLTLDCLYDNVPKYKVDLDLKVFLQGGLSGTNMNTNLRANNLLPTTDPYGLGTTATNIIAGDVVDWVLVEIRDPFDNTTIIMRQACLLRKDGKVLSADSSEIISFNGLFVSEGYIVIRHRNHLGVMYDSLVNFTQI